MASKCNPDGRWYAQGDGLPYLQVHMGTGGEIHCDEGWWIPPPVPRMRRECVWHPPHMSPRHSPSGASTRVR